jgi:hypothetical protein
MRRWSLFAPLLLCALPISGQQSNGLPERDRFLAEARKRLAGNTVLQSHFTYREHVTEVRMNPLGRIGTGPIEVYEVYPMPDDDLTYRRLVERAGQPVPLAELVQADREYLARLEGWRRDLLREGQTERRAREKKEAAEREKDRRRSQQAIGLFDFELTRREMLNGHPAIVVRFRPKPGIDPSGREAKIAASFAGEAWVHEHEHEVMRVHARALTDTSFGFGIIGKLYKDADALFRRDRFNGVWLPVETRVTGSGRALFRRVPINYLRQYSDYRPFNAEDLPRYLSAATSNR